MYLHCIICIVIFLLHFNCISIHHIKHVFCILHCICIVYLSEIWICNLSCSRWPLLCYAVWKTGWLTVSKSPPFPPIGYQIVHWIWKHTEFIRIGVDHRTPGKMQICDNNCEENEGKDHGWKLQTTGLEQIAEREQPPSSPLTQTKLLPPNPIRSKI